MDQGQSNAAEDNIVFLQRGEIDFPRLISTSTTEFELFSTCDQICRFFGLPYFSIRRQAERDETSLSSLSLMSNWPTFLITEYDSLGLLQGSPAVAHLKVTTEPLVWNIDELNRHRPEEERDAVASIFRKHGLENGVTFSAHLADGHLGVVSFAGPKNAPDYGRVIELNYLSNLIFNRLHEIRAEGRLENFGLKPREVECLHWTSQGKTSGEIATILDLSEHTVNHYLANAMRKLDTQNRTHAVSKAFRLRIIK